MMSARPRGFEDVASRPGWRLGGLWSRLNRSVTSLASSSSLRQTGSQWGSCDLEWDAEGTGFSPRRSRRRPPDEEQMSCGRTIDTCSVALTRETSPTSLDWDANFDQDQLETAAPPPPSPSDRMTTSDVTNGNFADVTDDETEQLIGQIDAMTQRTLAETGSVIGFIDDP
ncbi:uncharacterized protein LOC119093317 [Pollicipes pollicipes]|uniref:uncharacterized protein LOC119093317 n=1 Tax=Pollicipes pollicipes TaxID=41117 RepID=UPI00188582D0|nr:uncharacterized protein LOC119093317 [Pollicipes pollicipes]